MSEKLISKCCGADVYLAWWLFPKTYICVKCHNPSNVVEKEKQSDE